MDIENAIHIAMRRKQWTYHRLAKETAELFEEGVSASFLYAWARGTNKMGQENLDKVFTALGIPKDW